MLNFIFDLDDTLIATIELFNEAEQTFFKEMEQLGFNRNTVEQKFVEIDNDNIQIWGFKPKRFYTSMGETYETMCKLQAHTTDVKTRQKLEEIGRQVFITPPRVIEGVPQVLEMLIQQERVA